MINITSIRSSFFKSLWYQQLCSSILYCLWYFRRDWLSFTFLQYLVIHVRYICLSLLLSFPLTFPMLTRFSNFCHLMTWCPVILMIYSFFVCLFICFYGCPSICCIFFFFQNKYRGTHKYYINSNSNNLNNTTSRE